MCMMRSLPYDGRNDIIGMTKELRVRIFNRVFWNGRHVVLCTEILHALSVYMSTDTIISTTDWKMGTREYGRETYGIVAQGGNYGILKSSCLIRAM